MRFHFILFYSISFTSIIIHKTYLIVKKKTIITIVIKKIITMRIKLKITITIIIYNLERKGLEEAKSFISKSQLYVVE